jgi:ketosteroid isomerase-like protein
MSKENIEAMRRGYEAFNRGDMSPVADLATRDVEWAATGSFPGVEGLYRGPEAVQEWADLIHSDWEEFEVTLDEVLYDGDDVVVVAELLRARGSGVELERRIFAGYWFEEGKLRKRVAFTERGAALEAARLRD